MNKQVETLKYLEEVQKDKQSVNPLLNTLGIKIVELNPSKAVLSLTITPELTQGAGNLAGGILATLADEAMAHVLIVALNASRPIVTTDLNIRFLRAAQKGSITCEATILRQGYNTAFLDSKIYNENAELIAVAGATFYIHKA